MSDVCIGGTLIFGDLRKLAGYTEAIMSSKHDGCDVALYCIILKMLLNQQLFNRAKCNVLI